MKKNKEGWVRAVPLGIERRASGARHRGSIGCFCFPASFFFLLLVREGPSSSLARALKLLLHVWDINNYDGEMR